MNGKRLIGDTGESAVAKYLKRRLYRLVETNYSCRFGEIDIIARKGKYICFVEVKTRAPDSKERPAAAVNSAKQRRIIAAAQCWLAARRTQLQPRFDVAEVVLDGKKTRINYIENAFGVQ